MKQVIQSYRTGEMAVEDLPSPPVGPGCVLVGNAFSLISAGTERQVIALAKKSLIGKAKERPDLVRKVLDKMKRDGVFSTLKAVQSRLDEPLALGYSCAGTVLAVDTRITDLVPGDRVACAGAGYASHAQVVSVPRNLVVRIPDRVSFQDASYVTLGAIAMQGVRQANLTLGERVLVIGLGLLGQLTCQMVRAAGCRCIGLDTDTRRVELASSCGCDLTLLRTDPALHERILAFTDGIGPDACIVTASTSSSDPVELSGEILRDRGRVVVVGAVGMEIPRRPYYEKELDLRLSRSYGPGRYDHNYEEKGVDYPVGYVRWTENRNMQSFLDLVEVGSVKLAPLTTHSFSIDDALKAYGLVTAEGAEFSLGVLLSYPPPSQTPVMRVTLKGEAHASAATGQRAGIGLIGAGAFARSVLIPALRKSAHARLVGIANDVPAAARRTGSTAGFQYATGDYHQLLQDPDVQAVVVAVPHNLHAPLTVEALNAGKSVHVEKPLALSREQLQAVIDARSRSGKNVLVGFNRRFAPHTLAVREFLSKRTAPLTVLYRVNAGAAPEGHWVSDPEIGGGRILGEACHFIDLVAFLAGSLIVEVRARRLSPGDDSAEIWLDLADGSRGTVLYTAQGDASFSKERFECFTGGAVTVVDDFRTALLVRGGRTRKMHGAQDKGHEAEMNAFAAGVAGVKPWPVPFEQLVNSSLATLAALESMATGQAVRIEQVSESS